MSPRRNHRRPAKTPLLDGRQARGGGETVQSWPDGDWRVRAIPAGASAKTYRCPGCLQEIRPATAHVVGWPDDGRGDASDRRHWHTGCWRARDRRVPVVERSRNAPRHG